MNVEVTERSAGAGVQVLLINNRVSELADARDLDGDRVAALEPDGWAASEANSLGRAREDDGALLQGRALGEEGDELADGEDHVLRVGLLDDRAVEGCGDGKSLGIRDELGADQDGAKREERVEALAEAPLAATALPLPTASRDIVGASVAKDLERARMRTRMKMRVRIRIRMR